MRQFCELTVARLSLASGPEKETVYQTNSSGFDLSPDKRPHDQLPDDLKSVRERIAAVRQELELEKQRQAARRTPLQVDAASRWEMRLLKGLSLTSYSAGNRRREIPARDEGRTVFCGQELPW